MNLRDFSKQKVLALALCTSLMLLLSFTSGLMYIIFLRGTYGMRYANPFFMISFAMIFMLVASLYHLLNTRIQREMSSKPL